MKNTIPSYSRFRKDYETAKALGAASLACNAVLVPKGYEHLRMLIQNFQRPMPTNHDPADVDYAGGLQGHVQGVPKTSFEGSITMIETENGKVAEFAQAMVDNGGYLPECYVYFGRMDSDSDSEQSVVKYTIFDVAVTFSDGGGEIDASSRSQILTVQGSMRYMYFGDKAELGVTSSTAGSGSNGGSNGGATDSAGGGTTVAQSNHGGSLGRRLKNHAKGHAESMAVGMIDGIFDRIKRSTGGMVG